MVDPLREANARKLGESLLPDMSYEDRLKVADVALTEYGKVMAGEIPPFHRELVRTKISARLRSLFEGGETWAGQALAVYCCKVCFDRLADRYSPEGHQIVCGVTSGAGPMDGLVFHRAASIQFHGGSWDLNVYRSKCGLPNLTTGRRGSTPCTDCFEWW